MTDQSAERITAENATFRQRVREPHANGNLEERLQASRSNARFLDRRVAALEAQLAEALVPRDALAP
jgi:hypothetical protein